MNPAVAPTDRSTDRRLAQAATVLLLVPFLVVVAARAGRPWLPTQDFALIDLRVRDLLGGDLPLMGPYSRYRWNHPGPMLFWVLAPFTALAGGDAWGTLVGNVLVQAAGIGWAASLAWRVGRLTAVLLVDAVVALAYLGAGISPLVEPWGPYAVFPFFVVLLLQAHAIAAGEPRRLVGAVVCASFLVQSHAGYLPLVGAVAGWALLTLARRARRSGASAEPWRRPLLLAGLVGVGLWSLPLVAVVRDEPGNLRELARFFLGGDAPPAAGPGDALGVVAGTYRFVPSWLGATEPTDGLTGALVTASAAWLVVPVALLMAAGLVARRERSSALAGAVGLAAVLLVAGVAAASRVTDDLEPYLFLWRLPVSVGTVALGVGALLWGAGRLGPDRVRTAALALAAVAVVASGAVQVHRYVERPDPTAYEQLAADAVAAVDARGLEGTVRLRLLGGALGGLHGGIVDELDREGVDLVVDPDEEFQLGPSRIAPPGDEPVLYAVEDSLVTSLLASLPDAEVLFDSSPLDPADEAEVVALQRSLVAQLVAGGGGLDRADALGSELLAVVAPSLGPLDPDAVARLAPLNQQVVAEGLCRCSVVLVPAPTAAAIDAGGLPALVDLAA